MTRYDIDRFMTFEMTPQVDVDMPKLTLSEAGTNMPSCGVVYDLKLTDQYSDLDEEPDYKLTSLTEEELIALRDTITFYLKRRSEDPKRRLLKIL